MKIKRFVVAFLLITGIVFILLSLFKRDPQKYYQKLLSNNYETYHEMVDFMQQFRYQNVAIDQRSNDQKEIYTFDTSGSSKLEYSANYSKNDINRMLEKCFTQAKCQSIYKKGECIIFNISSTRDDVAGIMYINYPWESTTIFIDNERYELIELQNSQWFCFSTLNSRNLLK